MVCWVNCCQAPLIIFPFASFCVIRVLSSNGCFAFTQPHLGVDRSSHSLLVLVTHSPLGAESSLVPQLKTPGSISHFPHSHFHTENMKGFALASFQGQDLFSPLINYSLMSPLQGINNNYLAGPFQCGQVLLQSIL